MAFLALNASSFAKIVNPESLQAAYIQKFINYIDWPPSPGDKFTIAVLNNQSMHEALTKAFENGFFTGKQVLVIHLEKIKKNASYNIIHVSRADPNILKELTHLNRKGLLVVGHHELGACDGIQISFFFDQEQILRFDINQTLAFENSLKINSRLLNLARSLK